jgi:DNA-binding beta-propeller fold protein YncE
MSFKHHVLLPAGAMMTLAVSTAALQACSSQTASDSSSEGAAPNYPGMGGGAGSGGSSSYKDAAIDLPPEKEVESSYEYPAATGRYVWVANPLSGRVAYIDGTSLEVRTTQAGNGPTWLAAVPDPNIDTAIVINVLSSNATLLRADADGNIDTRELKVAQGNDSWAIEATGKYAIAWTDYRKNKAPPVSQGFQDVAVLKLSTGQEASTRLSVGYRPVAISFSSDASHAYAVTQDGISVIDLQAAGGPTSTKLVALSDDPLEDPGSRDVAVTPDGKYALVRRDGSAKITVVTLDDGTRTEVVLPGPATDLDLSPDGSRAIAVVRDTSQAVILSLPSIATTPDQFKTVSVDNAIIGSVSMAAAADVALLYTNASDQQRISRLDYALPSPTVTTLKLHAPVLGVLLARDGSGAIVLHDQIQGDPDSGTAGSTAPGAFSVLRMDTQLPAKLQSMQGQPVGITISTSGAYALLAESQDGLKNYGAYLVRMATQQVDRYELGSPPISVGVLGAANRGFIAQKHPEGRVTFLDLDTGKARTLTGFELGARVVDGSQAP